MCIVAYGWQCIMLIDLGGPKSFSPNYFINTDIMTTFPLTSCVGGLTAPSVIFEEYMYIDGTFCRLVSKF